MPQQAFRANDIDANLLRGLTSDDLKELGVASLGHRKLMLEAIAALDLSADDDPDQTATPGSDTATPATSASRRPPRPEAERRQLTVMLVDLVGSTELAGRLDPEDLGEIMRTYQKCCADVVKRWGGHVAKYMGDGILVYFGWPQAHEDDAERAVRTGLDLAAVVATLTTPAGDPLAARIGIATGLVMVGERVGKGAAQEEAVVGETPNLAARLQALTESGQVLIAESTRRLLGGVFALSDLGTRGSRVSPSRCRSALSSASRQWQAGSRRGAVRRSCRWWAATRNWHCCWSAGPAPNWVRARAYCWWASPGLASPGSLAGYWTPLPANPTLASNISARRTTPAARFGR
jgi:class 3 adenylate cyclase